MRLYIIRYLLGRVGTRRGDEMRIASAWDCEGLLAKLWPPQPGVLMMMRW